MKTLKLTILGLLLVASYNCKDAKKDAENAGDSMENAAEDMQEEASKAADEMIGKTVTATLVSKSDSDATGEITFTEYDGGVKMVAQFTGLEEGDHAIHLHQNADCSAADGTSAGGHWNPTDQPHGKWGDAGGYHKGDIGNFTADSDGNATVDFNAEGEWCIGCDDENKNIIGRSVIVHQGTDDFTSQPSGAAGARVGCAEINE